MVINHNMNAMNAHRNMGATNVQQGKAMEKLSSGLRINRAGDDAAGLAISEKMRSQIRGLNQASRNAQDGISMIQTAEGALSETQAIGQRMRELAVQSANGTYTDEDRKLIDQEFGQLKNEIDRIANDTEFNGNKVLNGNVSGKEIKTDMAGGSIKDANTVISQTGNAKDNIAKLFEDNVSAEDLSKLGEGNFELKFTVDNGGQQTGSVKIDLIDKSDFNGGKEYVMDSITITKDNTTDSLKFGDAEIKFDVSDDRQANEIFTKTGEVSIDFTNTAEKKGEGVNLQIGANQNQQIGFSIENMRSRELGLGGITVDTAENAQEAIGRLDAAVSKISAQRADLGANQNRLEHTIASTDNTAENLQAAESRIRDVDMAKEMMNLTKLNVLQQASQAMLSQANQAPQQVLSILR